MTLAQFDRPDALPHVASRHSVSDVDSTASAGC
jgi:hypothetical protein